jgi:hypothetical protein
MGARLALTRATITGPDGAPQKDRTVQAIGAVLRVGDGRTTLLERQDLDRADRTGPRTWRLTMTNGDTYTLERGKGCGCRGR